MLQINSTDSLLSQDFSFDESKFLYGIIYNLKKIIDEERSKVFELQKDAEKSVREKADLKLEVSSLTEEVSVSLTKKVASIYH